MLSLNVRWSSSQGQAKQLKLIILINTISQSSSKSIKLKFKAWGYSRVGLRYRYVSPFTPLSTRSYAFSTKDFLSPKFLMKMTQGLLVSLSNIFFFNDIFWVCVWQFRNDLSAHAVKIWITLKWERPYTENIDLSKKGLIGIWPWK